MLDTTNAGKARSFLNSQAEHAGAHAVNYRGVAFQATPAGTAFALVDGFAVIGSEQGVHSVIDTTLGGSSLAHASGYSKLTAVAPSGTLAHVFVNPTASGSSGSSGTSLGSTGLTGLLAGKRETNISIVPSTTSIALDADALGSGTTSGGLLASSAQGAQAAGELPGDSWLAVGLGNVGSTFGEDIQGLHALASLGASLAGSGAEAPATGALSLSGLLGGSPQATQRAGR